MLTVNGVPLPIEPAQLGSALTATPQGRELVLGVDPARLRDAIAPSLGAFERAPVDASFAVNGGVPAVVPSQNGHVVDLASAVPAILRGERSIPTGLIDQPAGRTTEQLQAHEHHRAGVVVHDQPRLSAPNRVKNIHRGLRHRERHDRRTGRDVLPERHARPAHTRARASCRRPRSRPSEGFYDDYGGGVSQFSTTLFNATFFGGYKDVAHTPHSIYISRYPMGREATLDYPGIDNKFQNDSSAGVLITCGYTGHVDHGHVLRQQGGADVRGRGARTSSRRSRSRRSTSTTRCCPAGVEQPISTETGYTGYRVENYRIISRPGQADQRETFRWSYDMRPREDLPRRARADPGHHAGRGRHPAPARLSTRTLRR